MILKKATVLIVDDDPDVLTAVKLLLKPEAREIITEKNPENLNWLLQRNGVDLILLDMNFNSAINTGNEGLYWLRKVKEWKPDVCVIMITAYGDIDLAVRSLKEGANDFVVKPWHNEKLINTIKDLLDKKEGGTKTTKTPVKSTAGDTSILGESDVMQDIFYKVNKIAPTDANILILGENGTGKDLMAKAIHERSLRADKPFIKVDVGALTDTLFESELFGHKKGAFTDAREDRMGRFEEAQGGTLFLDEIGNISLQQQAKLLTILQNRQVTRLGTNKPVDVDIRLICATNVPLSELANENKFRKDLIYRINTVEINMPPLRRRNEDIVILARHFAKLYSSKYLKPSVDFDTAAINKLKSYNFPGNVRELQYTIERAVIMADDNTLRPDDLIFSILETSTESVVDADNIPLSALEKNAILRVIEKHNGNITRAAKELGLTRTALYRRLSKYDI
ncbi:sigma-54-dependent Fis family transcriptional regulator [Mucilaginibacter rubeus]|uniref:Sigma-54-dependent Fis family transcriptional regulator n=1 Tax=Mucilaginibacter rubeus TaxID=2027860 RepID=A0AAE6MI37_9SPHI|nr:MULTISPECIES: sigma-54 dependent transcriptional regulator [Mucilaginibacter]QEM04143.1 sigma-54-dependent Fis family transcriptional regulator [Mucilaginibacter rubeus]QEM16745.1 sigma-54-dependent Fis family transcriptional regulator [Mucilaginibacter gossypii]QTE46777.1 sigma-54-dependent Fis family transcriptional regulator [Mucilaginibacter rubeus]QTE53374.1 sigma-54-dependent Fis family transcriptional regulator [Mucilaginibacter rubeus]QTE58460.1 sigma-54-dependent Fis family transcr